MDVEAPRGLLCSFDELEDPRTNRTRLLPADQLDIAQSLGGALHVDDRKYHMAGREDLTKSQ